MKLDKKRMCKAYALHILFLSLILFMVWAVSTIVLNETGGALSQATCNFFLDEQRF